jgi:hypothetical protein
MTSAERGWSPDGIAGLPSTGSGPHSEHVVIVANREVSHETL